ncbi:MAG: tetratricopeptide repeat protein [Lysobacterales bacterium]
MDITFEESVEFVRVGQGEDNRTLLLRLKAQARPQAAAAAAPTAPSPPASNDPVAMLASAKAMLAAQDYDGAIALLNQVLNLPPNDASQEAQELIGQVREALGSDDRARAEYQLYLKLYPDGPGAERARARLAGLDLPEAEAVASGRTAPAPGHDLGQRVELLLRRQLAHSH